MRTGALLFVGVLGVSGIAIAARWPDDANTPGAQLLTVYEAVRVIRTDQATVVEVAIDPETCFACGSEVATIRDIAFNSPRVVLGLSRTPKRAELVSLRQSGLSGLQVLVAQVRPESRTDILVTVRSGDRIHGTTLLKLPSSSLLAFVDSLKAILRQPLEL